MLLRQLAIAMMEEAEGYEKAGALKQAKKMREHAEWILSQVDSAPINWVARKIDELLDNYTDEVVKQLQAEARVVLREKEELRRVLSNKLIK